MLRTCIQEGRLKESSWTTTQYVVHGHPRAWFLEKDQFDVKRKIMRNIATAKI